jgi:hypothetical protein
VLRAEEGALVLAAEGGALRIGRMRVDDAKKAPAAESGLAAGDRLT